MAIQRLTAAYRSRSRPSSTLGAKASTMCPYYLDGDLLSTDRNRSGLGDTRYIGYCAVFKVREEVAAPPTRPGADALWPGRDAARSLKTQQHATDPAERGPPIQARSTCLVTGALDESAGGARKLKAG
jgi:hypothetical protein